VEEQDGVAVLLDRPRLPDVRQPGRPVLGLALAVQLGQGQHRHPQLLGQELEPAGDLRHLLVPLGLPVLGLHQLQVVHDHERQAGAAGQPAGHRGDLGDGHVDAVLERDRQAAEPVVGGVEGADVLRPENAPPHPPRVHVRVADQQPLRDLFVRHLQADEQDCLGGRHPGRCRGGPQGAGGLPDPRPGGESDQLPGV
jgi:hypothetical protein